jgi:transposase
MAKKVIGKPPSIDLHKKRKEVIRLYLDEVPVMQIVQRIGLSWPAVNRAIKIYKSGGEAALKPSQRGRKKGAGRELSSEQEAMIFGLICGRRPWQCGVKTPYHGVKIILWNRDVVGQLIDQKFNIKLSVRSVGNYLERWGFPQIRKKKRAGCPKVICDWLDEDYAVIQTRAQTEGAKIFWTSKTTMDNPEAGAMPEREGLLQRKSMIIATTNQGKAHWLVIKGRFTPERQVMFLKSLIGESREKIFMIRDNHDYYTSSQVRDWMNENKNRIELFPPPEWGVPDT